MDIESIRKETAEKLGVSMEEVSYITEELIEEYQSDAKAFDSTSGDAEGLKEEGSANWGAYGNRITFSGNLCYWKQGPRGSANYGCGTSESWSAGKEWAKYIKYRGECGGGIKWFFLGNYNG